MPPFWTLDDVKVIGKRVLLRLDLNVPMKDGEILDDTRLQRCAATINELLLQNARIVILSHFGRPEGKYDKSLSLEPIAQRLSSILKQDVTFLHNCVGEDIEQHVRQMKPREIVLLENVRFHSGEETCDLVFSRQLSHLGDIFVNDAFSVSHRAHASTVGVTTYLQAVAGRLLEEEINALSTSLDAPVHPVLAIVGGAKVSTKLSILENLVQKVDTLVLGGGIANTFLLALGKDIGRSLVEPSLLSECNLIIEAAKQHNCQIILPEDVHVAEAPDHVPSRNLKEVSEVQSNEMILDFGPKTIKTVQAFLAEAKTAIWNGPVGLFEVTPYDKASMAIATTLGQETVRRGLLSIAGGGETLAVLKRAGQLKQISFASTAGGAFLEWLEGRDLPGIMVLQSKGDNKACS